MKLCLTNVGRVAMSWSLVIAIGLTLVSGQALATKVQSDFDPGGTYFGGIEGWFNYAGLPEFTTATPTGGSTLWLRVQPNQFWGQITSQSWATPDITVSDWNSHNYLEFDVIVDSGWLPNNPAQVITVEFQTVGGVGGTINQYATPTIDTSLKDTVQHISIPLAPLQPFDSTATGWNLSINLSPGYAWEWDPQNPDVQPYDAHYYIDNVTWVSGVVIPEPGTLALGGVLVGGLVGWRRIRPLSRPRKRSMRVN